MTEEKNTEPKSPSKNPLFWFDSLVKKFIPNFNARAILYFSAMFAIAMYIQIWRMYSPSPIKEPVANKPKETVIADQTYWDSQEYLNKIRTQTVASFTDELGRWLNKTDQEFSKRKFEDILFINSKLAPLTGEDLTQVIPENFNYLENIARARYQYAKDKGFLNDAPTLVKLGTVVCNINEKTEQITGIELYDWHYASMPKLAEFMKTKPNWKVQVGDKILDVSDPRIEDKDILKYRTAQTQPTGLFSFLIFHDPTSNRIVLADSAILDSNGVDTKLTLSRIDQHWEKQPKLYFSVGYDSCQNLNAVPQIPYGQSD